MAVYHQSIRLEMAAAARRRPLIRPGLRRAAFSRGGRFGAMELGESRGKTHVVGGGMPPPYESTLFPKQLRCNEPGDPQ